MKVLMKLASALLWMAAGASAYLYYLNRLLIQIRDRRYKSFMIRGGGLIALAVSGALGWLSGWTRWSRLPAAVLLVAAAGEARRLLHRKAQQGAAPVWESRASCELTQPITTTDLVFRGYEIVVKGWKGPRLRVAHLSDFHLNSHLPLSYFEHALRQLSAMEPDLVLFTGDFITYRKFIPLIGSVLPLARGRLGAFGVIGNHDYWAGPQQVRTAARAAGIQMLDGDPVRLRLPEGSAVVLAGYEHPWSKESSTPAAREEGELALLLTHTPDNIYHLRQWGFDAVFAGHYHGGQMRLPVLGPLVVPSKYGRRYDRGHFVFGKTHLFVTAGVGSAEPPVRLWCPPDILIVDFLPDESGGAWQPFAS